MAEPTAPSDPRPEDAAAVPPRDESAEFESYPLTRSEYITTMVHFYRGEMARANTWRLRLDMTTNWAVVTAAALISFAFSQPEHSHVTVLLSNVMVTIFLFFEARRFRYFDVWRARIRMIEENFLVPMLRRNLVSPRLRWRDFVAEDLDNPTYKVTFLEAVAMRLRRNFIWLYTVLILIWFVKLNLHPVPAENAAEAVRRMSVGAMPGPVVLALVLSIYGGAIVLTMTMGKHRGGADEVHGVEQAMDHWKY